MTAVNMSLVALLAALLIYTGEASNPMGRANDLAPALEPEPALAPEPAQALEPAQAPPGYGKVFDVTDYGAVGDGETDDTMAFLSAWDDACDNPGKSTLLVPVGTFFIGPVSFAGPCYNDKSPKVVIGGTLKAPSFLNASTAPSWILFRHLKSLTITGQDASSLDARGGESWKTGNCRKRRQCQFTVTLKLVNVSNGVIENINLKDGKAFHIGILNSDSISVNGVNITAPWDSPNTDGIHIERSTNVTVQSSTMGVGDDCVSIGPGNTNITVVDVKCGPGHGISVGSLGKYIGEKDLVGVTVKNCTINGTTNGVRIKTWPGSLPSYASDLTFEDIVMINVSNPILIDQEYCPWNTCTTLEPSLVKLRNVHFKNIRGTFSTESGAVLICSESVPCEDVRLVNVNLTRTNTPAAIHSLQTPRGGGGRLKVKGALQFLEIKDSSF